MINLVKGGQLFMSQLARNGNKPKNRECLEKSRSRINHSSCNKGVCFNIACIALYATIIFEQQQCLHF